MAHNVKTYNACFWRQRPETTICGFTIKYLNVIALPN